MFTQRTVFMYRVWTIYRVETGYSVYNSVTIPTICPVYVYKILYSGVLYPTYVSMLTVYVNNVTVLCENREK